MNNPKVLCWFATVIVVLACCGPLGAQVTTPSAVQPNVEAGADAVWHVDLSVAVLNRAWILLAGFLIFLMQAGFALLETGMTRAKNAAHTMAMNMVVFGIATLCFWACGYGFMFGDGRPGYFFLAGRPLNGDILALFFLQVMFLDTAATIPTGVLAERWKFLSFVAYVCFLSIVIYPVFGGWVWGNGWLARLGSTLGLRHGYLDFAGSSVVHMVGGVAGLVSTYLVGPRIGKFKINGMPNPIPAHNAPMYMFGTLILAFGWFGFNTGNARSILDANLPRIAVNTVLAGAGGAIAAMTYTWVNYKKPDPSFLCNGTLAGLVAITASCPYVAPWAAVAIGGIAGVLVIWSCMFFERVLRVDDPVGAISVHGTNGMWGALALGIFADGTVAPYNTVAGDGNVAGLLYGGGSQILAQCIGIAACFTWVGSMSFVFFAVAGRLIGNRVSAQAEFQGLDVPELGALGYVSQDFKVPDGHAVVQVPAEPRAARVPPNGHKRFIVHIDGVDTQTLMIAWSNLCQARDQPPPAEFRAVYPYMTTVEGNRFEFRGGDSEAIRANLERLFQLCIKSQEIRARSEPYR